jgi:aminoglycoside 3-N-acetyltransferase
MKNPRVEDQNSSRRVPAVTGAKLKEGLARVGVRRGDTVLAHTSLSRFGYVEGGADTVVDALMELLGPKGTLMMSAITTTVDFVIRCIKAADLGVLADVEPFDPASTPTWAGAVAETFRHRPGVLRSLHPTHSVSAWGKGAGEMIAGHQNAAGPCGEGTPYARVTELPRGYILLLGVNHSSNTTLHGLEEIAGCEYALYPKDCRIPIRTSRGIAESRTRVHLPYLARRLGVLETEYLDGLAQTVTYIGASCVRYINAVKMREITLTALAKTPDLLLAKEGRIAYGMMRESGVWTKNPLAGAKT